MKKRLLALLLSLIMAFSAFPFGVVAEGALDESGEDPVFMEGSETTFYADGFPDHALAGEITWESSDPSAVAFVITGIENGRPYALCQFLKEGTVQITVRSDTGYSDSVTVRIAGLPTFREGEELVVDLQSETQKYAFVPKTDGFYVFTLRSEGVTDMNLRIVDENDSFVCDKYVRDETLECRVKLEANKRYKILFYGETETLSALVEKALVVTGISVSKNPLKTSYVKGYLEGALDLEGLELKLGYEDGTFKTVKYEELESISEEISVEVDYETGVVTFSCEGKTCHLALTFTEASVARLELVSGAAKDLVENYHGYMDYHPDPETGGPAEVFIYNTPEISDFRVRVVYKDGTEKVVNPAESLDGYGFFVTDDQREEPWGVGDHSFTLSYPGASLEIPVRVIPNPVLSIETVSPVKVIENANGFWDCGRNMFGEFIEYFYYYIPDDIALLVRYRDGSSKLANAKDELDGEFFETYSFQNQDPWVKGGANVLYGRYLGVEFEIPVEVVENPIASITVDSAPSRVYVYGDPLWGWMSDEGYCLNPEDPEGLKFTLNMKDGTKKSYTSADIDEDGNVDGYFLSLQYAPLMELGENTVTMEYMGLTAEYQITLKASPYSSIQVKTPLPYTTVSGKYMPYFDGLSLLLTKTDGTTETVTVTKDNVTLSPDGEGYLIKGENGLQLFVEPFGFDVEPGTVIFRVYCHDKYCDLAPLNVENEINVATKVENVSMTSPESGGQVKVTWEDGTSETVTLQPNPEVLSEDEGFISLLYRTEEGYLQVYAEIRRTTEGDVFAYHLSFPFWNIYDGMTLIPIPEDGSEERGDLDGNGTVSSADAIYLLYFTLFGEVRYPINQPVDFDGNGKTDSADAIYLLYHTLFGSSRYPLS